MAYLETQAIVLRSTLYRETSRMVTLFSAEAGRISVSAKGAVRPKSLLRLPTELFSVGRYTLSGGNGRWTISGAQVDHTYYPLCADLKKLALAVYFRDFCENVLTEDEPQPELYSLLLFCLDALCTQADMECVRTFFEVRAMDILGFCPELMACAQCGSPLEEDVFFSPSAGGAVCPRCRSSLPDVKPMLKGTLTYLRRLLRWEGELSILRSNAAIERELALLWRPYIGYYLERNFRYAGFMDQLHAFEERWGESI